MNDVASAKPSRLRRILLVLLGLVAGVIAVALAAAWLLGERRGEELEITISIPRERFLQGVSIPMELRVQNVSNHPVEADRFAPFDEDECVSLFGKPIELTLFYEDLPEPSMRLLPEPGDVGPGVLEPGETLELQCNIAQLFGLMKPGVYTLEASYVRDRWAQAPSFAWPARILSSVVRHDPVRFQILSRIYDTQNEKVNELGNKMGESKP